MVHDFANLREKNIDDWRIYTSREDDRKKYCIDFEKNLRCGEHSY